jgi:spore coat protein CotF
MNGMQNSIFPEKEQITDLLSAEKFLAGNYNSFLLESATPEMVRCFSSLLADTHTMQQTIFNEMQERGWYAVTKAEDTKLNQTKQKFTACVSK